jgi:flavin reductase (DIM6/NTAB) family NADH-FMN oxidoreductase RutF/DNA-binding transcriptional LysR family regulator
MRQTFLEGMSRAAATVSIVTTGGKAGRAGVTVSAMCSVSADSATPSLLVCVHVLSKAAQTIQENGAFCVNVLRDDQAHIADTFAGRTKTISGDKFECGAWNVLASGAPVLADSLVAFDCSLKKAFQHGSHWVFVGELIDLRLSETGSPLVYANRAYGKPVPLHVMATQKRLTDPKSRSRLDLGYLVNLGPYFLPDLLSEFLSHHPGTMIDLAEGDEARLVQALISGDISMALAYDLELGENVERIALCEMQPYVLLPSEHPLARSASIPLHELVSEPMVLLDLPGVKDRTLSWFSAIGAMPEIRYRSSSFEMVRSMVGNGFGYTLLVTKPANSMSYDGKALAACPLGEPVAGIRLVLAWKKGTELAEADASFARCCETHFRSRLSS